MNRLVLLLVNLQTSKERLENATIIVPRCVHLLENIWLSMDLNVPRFTLKSSWITIYQNPHVLHDAYNKELQRQAKEVEPGETVEVTESAKKCVSW